MSHDPSSLDELLTSPLDDEAPTSVRWVAVGAGVVVLVLAVVGWLTVRGTDGDPAVEETAAAAAPPEESGEASDATVPPVPDDSATTTVPPTTAALELTAGYPTERISGGMERNPAAGGIALFGGMTFGGSLADGTWWWDVEAETWSELTTVDAPPLRVGHAMEYVDGLGGTLLFGGGIPRQFWTACLIGICSPGFMGDTWLLDAAEGTWRDLQPPTAPEPRLGAGLAYDAESELVVLFGGVGTPSEDAPTRGTLYEETWVLDPANADWRIVETNQGPAPRALTEMVYDPATDLIYLWGGRVPETTMPPDDMWTFDVDTGTWTELTIEGATPPPRWHHRWVLDPVTSTMVLIGGEWFADGERRFSEAVWRFDPATLTWERGADYHGFQPIAAADGIGILMYAPEVTERYDAAADEIVAVLVAEE